MYETSGEASSVYETYLLFKNSIITYHLFCSKSHSLEQFTAVLLLLGDDYHMSHFTLSLVKTHHWLSFRQVSKPPATVWPAMNGLMRELTL